MLGSAFAASCFTTGCIIPEAPEYGPARQTPVFVEANSIFPNPLSMQRYDTTGNPAEFRMTVRSEDAGTELVSALYVDYKHKNGFYVDHKEHKPPETFDKERLISWTYNLAGLDGPSCHIFTVTVLHATGWDFENNKQIGSPPDLAAVSWYARINDDGSGLLVDCPDVSTESAETAPK
jgi:hypothetical protein